MRKLSNAVEISDLKHLARRRVPKMFYDYVDSGSWTETTYRKNETDFSKYEFRQRVLVDVSARSLNSRMIGQNVSMPIALSPVGMAGMQYPDGEIHAARAAQAAGVPFTLSTVSICSIEDVAASTERPFWFQLYVMRDRDFAKSLIERARAARCSALVLTVDLPVGSQRHRDTRNALSTPPKLTFGHVIQMATRPRWCAGMLTTKRRSFGNIVGHARGVDDLSSLATWSSEQLDSSLSWRDIEWVKKLWGGPLILKGILDAEDGRSAIETGADAIVVSNHGGRQLDGAPSSISSLSRIADVVGDRIEVLFDGGVRSGQDVLKAIALGAKGVFVGRPFLFGLGAGGEAGVKKSLDIIRKELDLTMAFCGKKDIEDVDRQILIQQ